MSNSNWDKFCLLMWKNYKLRLRNKLTFILEILVPAVVMILLILLRMMGEPVVTTEPYFFAEQPITINDLRMRQSSVATSPVVKWELVYSPENSELHKIVELASNKLGLTSKPVPTSDAYALELLMQNPNQSLVGIEFPDELKPITQLPNNIKYALRFPIELRCKESTGTSTWTDAIYPTVIFGGPRNIKEPDGAVEYIREGFIAVQESISKSFIELLSKRSDLPKIQMKRMPYPPFQKDTLLVIMANFVPIVFMLSFSYSANLITKQLLIEKEKQLKEVMKIMGLPNWLHWIAWFMTSFINLFVATILIVFVLKFNAVGVPVFQHSEPTVLAVFFLCYACGLITFCFMATSFFKSSSSGTAAISLIFFIFYMPYVLKSSDIKLFAKLLLSGIFLNTGLAFATDKLLELELNGSGLQWSNLFVPLRTTSDQSSVGLLLLTILILSMVQMLIALYVEKINPGTYGVSEKWYFPFTRQFWKDLFMKESPEDRNVISDYANNQEKRIGISIKGLSRTFNEKTAVDNLTMNMYEDEITVLLGHNGAGKTTTISMLTGMIPSTSGTATLNGYDINKNLSAARKSIGLCPQYNILFDNLTVREHLIFYGRLKGLNKAQIELEVTKFVKTLELESKINTISKDLSGGVQKKLSVCAALCGGSKVVFCDEPSSGMDASARHSFWKLLQAEKKGRTILLSTHYMDEADALGDKIAIMNAGKLVCFGTSFALKKEYGVGYHLICVKKENCITENVTKLLTKYIPDIIIEVDIALELSYQLPIRYSNIFHEMLRNLENNLDNLRLEGFGISMTTMEEVFLRAGAEQHQEEDVPKSSNTSAIVKVFDQFLLLRGRKLLMSQCKAMILKKLYATYRNIMLLLIQNGMAIFFIVTALIAGVNEKKSKTMPDMLIDFHKYGKTHTMLEIQKDLPEFYEKIANQYEINGKSFGSNYDIETTTSNLDKYILNLQEKDMELVDSEYIIACTIKRDYIIAWFNNQLLHTSTLSLNMIHNAILKAIFPDDKHYIEVSNKPLPYSFKSKMNDISMGTNTGLMIVTNLGIALPFVASLGLFYLVKEQRNRAKLLQYLTGLKVFIFWCTQYIFDLVLWLVTASLIVIVIACFREAGLSGVSQLVIIFILLMLFAVCYFPLTYIASMLTNEPSTAYGYITGFGILTGLVLYLICTLMDATGLKKVSDKCRVLFLIFPQFNVLNGLGNLFAITENIGACHKLCPVFKLTNCEMDVLCDTTAYCCVKGYLDWEFPGSGKNIFFLIFYGLIFFIIVLFKEYRCLDGLIYKVNAMIRKQPKLSSLDRDDIDDDVKNEKHRVKLLTQSEIAQHSLVLRGVTKYYGNKFLAVKSISVGIKISECFGLLGTNGAGKTTTFKMMTGDESITFGEAYITGINIKTHLEKAYKQIGYCPQFDGLLDELTCRQTIQIFCLMRGVPEMAIERLTNIFSEAFGYKAHLNKLTFKCSGGTKRKVSTTIALVGKPAIVFLDEPTTGMDPGSRRLFWDIINAVRASGVALVLTSHSMDECEALCTRLAIMVNGEFRCIGSIQHLKNKFAQGLILKIKLRQDIDSTAVVDKTTNNLGEESSSTDENQLNSAPNMPHDYRNDEQNMKKFVQDNFPNSVLKEQYQSIFTYYIPTSFMRWSDIFRIMEENKIRLNFEDYSICQTTLEQIFLELVREQLAEAEEAAAAAKTTTAPPPPTTTTTPP